MSRQDFAMSAMASAAKAVGCTVHLHQNEQGHPVFSMLKNGPRDFAAQAGAGLAENCINAMLASNDQTESANLLAVALIGLASLAHYEHAAAGFAGVLVATIEHGIGVQL